MKAKRILTVMFACLWMAVCSSPATAAFDSGSTGADGAFNPTASTELQIPESGVFNFTTVNIPSGVTITFKKNSQNTPVTILASGDVTITGTISLNGNSAIGIYPATGGPGGFGGGYGGPINFSGGRGMGAGGGSQSNYFTCWFNCGLWSCASGTCSDGGGGGGFGSGGGNSQNYSGLGGIVYSNDRIIPLIGGSGGGGGGGNSFYVGGGGGGGAGTVLIVSSGTVNVTGAIYANGGNGANAGSDSNPSSGSGGGGSGGAIKLVANKITGNGTISANGGGAGTTGIDGGGGGSGRIRLEANELLRTTGTSPGYSFGFPDTVSTSNMPVLKVSSIGGISVPDVVSASFSKPDIVFPTNVTNPITIGITASYIPLDTTITVTAAPQFGAATTVTVTGLTGTPESSSATASITLSKDYPSVISLTATFTVQLASNGMPLYVEGEKVVKMRVASVLGGNSSVTYITESGKEVDAHS